MEISYITTLLGLVVHEVALSLSFAHVNSDKGSFIAAIMPMLLGIYLAPIHCLSSRSLTSNTSREFIVYYVLQDRRPLGLCLVSSNLWRSTTSQTFPAGREDIVLMWRLNIRLHKVAPVDPALQRPIEIDAKMEKPEEIENVPIPGGIVVTKHQATLTEEAVRLVLLWWGGTTVPVVLEGTGDGRLSSY